MALTTASQQRQRTFFTNSISKRRNAKPSTQLAAMIPGQLLERDKNGERQLLTDNSSSSNSDEDSNSYNAYASSSRKRYRGPRISLRRGARTIDELFENAMIVSSIDEAQDNTMMMDDAPPVFKKRRRLEPESSFRMELAAAMLTLKGMELQQQAPQQNSLGSRQA